MVLQLEFDSVSLQVAEATQTAAASQLTTVTSVAVTVQFVGCHGGEAGGSGAPGPWRHQPAPTRSTGDVISEKFVIS
jgi:hypothetical protein